MMDAMALLCTLHADGPATLKNLRQAGCSSLEAVESMEEQRLARLLGGPQAAARRFAREARHLRERLGQGILEREEPPADASTVWPGHFAHPPGEPAGASSASSDADASGPVDRPEPDPLEPDRVEPDPLENVLAAWRARDLEDASPILEEEIPPRPVRARPEFEFGTELALAVQEIASAVELAETGARGGLIAGEIDGLDEGLCHVLGAAGVVCLEDLAGADALALSRDLGRGYTHFWRLTQLARRALAMPTRSGAVDEMAGGMAAKTVGGPVLGPLKLSPSEAPARLEPSILELEWNLEIRPTPPPAVHGPVAARDAPLQGIAPGQEGRSREEDEPTPEGVPGRADRESAGGPFA